MNSRKNGYINGNTHENCATMLHYKCPLGFRDSYISATQGGFTKQLTPLMAWGREEFAENKRRVSQVSSSSPNRIPFYKPDGTGRDTYVTH